MQVYCEQNTLKMDFIEKNGDVPFIILIFVVE